MSEKKKTPAKSVGKSAGAKKEKSSPEIAEKAEEKKSNLTPQVLKLVEKKRGVNPVATAGKSVVPPKLRGRQPLSKVLKQQAERAEDISEDSSEETEVVNVTELVIKKAAPEILDRFNACSCDKCVEIFSEIVSPKIRVRYARVPKNSGVLRTEELISRAESVRKEAVDVMTRELVGTKIRCYHDKDTE